MALTKVYFLLTKVDLVNHLITGKQQAERRRSRALRALMSGKFWQVLACFLLDFWLFGGIITYDIVTYQK